jgi:hypothetical protein
LTPNLSLHNLSMLDLTKENSYYIYIYIYIYIYTVAHTTHTHTQTDTHIHSSAFFSWHCCIFPRLGAGAMAGFEFGSGIFSNGNMPEDDASNLIASDKKK